MAWDAGDPECLLQLVKELLQQYHQYQCQRLRDSSRLLFEYDSLLEDPNYGRNMEIYAGRKNSWVMNLLLKKAVGVGAVAQQLSSNTSADGGAKIIYRDKGELLIIPPYVINNGLNNVKI